METREETNIEEGYNLKKETKKEKNKDEIVKKEGDIENKSDNDVEGIRQNRSNIVLGIFAAVVSVFGSILGLSIDYTNNIEVPIGSVQYTVVYYQTAVLIACLITVAISTIVFLYYELKRNVIKADNNNGERIDCYYNAFVKILKIIIVTMIIDTEVFLAGYFYKKSICIYVITIAALIISIIYVLVLIVKKLKRKDRKFTKKVIVKTTFVVLLFMFFVVASCFYLVQHNYTNNSNLTVSFDKNGMVYIDKEGLSTDIIKVKITYWEGEEFLWEEDYNESGGRVLRGRSGVYKQIGNKEVDVRDAGNAVWNKAKLYSHFEINLEEIKNIIKGKENEKISCKKDDYIITITIEQNSQKIITENHFKKVKCQKYSFAKDKVSIDYTDRDFNNIGKK